MAKVIPQRMSAQVEGDFVVFLIGMRINKPWKVHKWLPVFLAMPKMLKELERRPESGFLGAVFAPKVIVQYWRSFEQLEAYAVQVKVVRRAVGGSRDAHQAALALHHRVVARASAPGAVRPVARDRRVHDAGMARADLRLAEAHPVHGAGPEVLGQDVR